jgi:hypothetical protein
MVYVRFNCIGFKFVMSVKTVVVVAIVSSGLL